MQRYFYLMAFNGYLCELAASASPAVEEGEGGEAEAALKSGLQVPSGTTTATKRTRKRTIWLGQRFDEWAQRRRELHSLLREISLE